MDHGKEERGLTWVEEIVRCKSDGEGIMNLVEDGKSENLGDTGY